MKRFFIALVFLLIIAALAYAFADSKNLGGIFRTVTPTLTSTPTFTNTPTETSTSTPTLTATPTATQTPTYTPSPTPTNAPLQPTKKPKSGDGENNDNGGSGNPCEPYPWCDNDSGNE